MGTVVSEPEVETVGCSYQIHPERRYLRNGDPGDPAEYCDEDAVPGEEFCEGHLGALYAEDSREDDLADDIPNWWD